jgi:hypothetical protein
MIPEYAEALAARLAFDPALARSVRAEVEDHLWEAAAADREGGAEAERRAIASFGDAHALASQFAAMSLARRARGIASAVVFAVVAVFVLMKGRVEWLASLQHAVRSEPGPFAALVLSIDRYAFWIAVVAAIASWAYLKIRRIPANLAPQYHRRLRRFFILGAGAMAALVVSVLCDAVLTGIRVAEMKWTFAALVPVLSMVLEIVGTIAIGRRVLDDARRAALANRAFDPPA